MDGQGEDLIYEFDSTSNPYFQGQAWDMTLQQVQDMFTDEQRRTSPSQSNMQSNIHGLRQTTMAEHPMLNAWGYQQLQTRSYGQQHLLQSAEQQQQQQLQEQEQHLSQQQYQLVQTTQPTAHHPMQQMSVYDPQRAQALTYNNVFQNMSLPAQMTMMPAAQATLPMSLPLDAPFTMTMPSQVEGMQNWDHFHNELVSSQASDWGSVPISPYHQQHIASPTGSHLEILSQPSSADESGWGYVNTRTSFDTERSFFVDPTHTLHDRSISESSFSDFDMPQTGFLSNLDMGPTQAVYSPTSFSDSDWESTQHQHRHSIDHSCSQAGPSTGPLVITTHSKDSSPARSPAAQGSVSSPVRKAPKKSAIMAKGTERITKKTSPGSRDEKKVGKRKGPLKPEQRKQASEIRKLRACLRCKFLKKTCDPGQPCAGCQPSHARLWQVPCTRIDIKEIGYFLKDKKFDYERHVSLGFSVGNIKGFSDIERTVYITHGYGHIMPVVAREVYVRDEKCMSMDWVEAAKGVSGYEVSTAKLSAGTEGIDTRMLSEYLDRHIENPGTFDNFVEEYFEGTPFLSEMLKTAYNYYTKTHNKTIKRVLKLMLAYNLTLHITMVEGLPSEEPFKGKIEDQQSKFFGKTMAPVMINFQIKCAMADMWRELHKDVLEELSQLYSSVYTGDKLKNWPTIFIVASVLLAVWECMQFDCHYRVPDEAVVDRFCTDMEKTPFGVINGLFQAISQKLPSLLEWDTQAHHHLFDKLDTDIKWDVCDTLTTVRGHISKYESYLRDRPKAKFDSKDFDSLSNKFLSRLVLRDIRAN